MTTLQEPLTGLTGMTGWDAAAPAATVPDAAGGVPDWGAWSAYFAGNARVQQALEDRIDWGEAMLLGSRQRRAWVASVQRFQLGESGDGVHLLGELRRGGEDDVHAAAQAFVAEEGGHARLLRRLLARFDAVPLEGHWSDAAFVAARRLLGVATELSVIAVAEAVALVYYDRLAEGAPDPVIRGVARRILSDELGHVPFVTSRIVLDLARWGRLRRSLLRLFWWAAGVGATVVLAVDHAGVLRQCGTTRRAVVLATWRSVRDVRCAAYARGHAVRCCPRPAPAG